MTRSILLAAGLAFAALPAGADVLQSCEADIATYCSEVEPGHGRILSCLYAHELVISDACDAATSDTSDLIDLFFERLRIVATACSPDIHAHCADVAVGQGRLYTCLAEKRAELGADCAALVDGMELPEDS